MTTATLYDKYELAAATEYFSVKAHVDAFCFYCDHFGDRNCPGGQDPTDPACVRYDEFDYVDAIVEEARELREMDAEDEVEEEKEADAA